MSHGNQNSPVLNLDDLVALAIRLGYDCDLTEKDIETVGSRCAREGLFFLTNQLPLIAKAMCAGVSSGRFVLPQGFGPRRKGSQIPSFLSDLLLEIFDYDGNYLDSDNDGRAFRNIYQFCNFFYKMKTPFTDDQVSKFSDQFINTDADVRFQSYIGSDPTLDRATKLITDVFKDFRPDELICSDGPGVIANGTFLSKGTKKLASYASTHDEYLPHFFLNQTAMLEEMERWPDRENPEVPVSKVIFVPKDARGPRVISAEPRENQYLQQGIRRYMYKAMETSPLTSGRVNFADQSVNQRLALDASRTRRRATIDLKEASDRVSLALVHRLFSGVPLLRRYILDSRSPLALLPDGRIVYLNKFAPMGSALCFPVMAVVIFSLIKAAMINRDSSLDTLLCVSPDKEVYVYGDDIIVDVDFSYLAMDTLQSFGLLVNTNKSYVGSPFAESCGQDAYKGSDVSPVRLRVSLDSLVGPWCLPNGKQRHRMLDSDGLSLIETINLLDQAGRTRSARYLLSKFEATFGCLPIAHSFSGYPCIHKHGELAEFIQSEGCPRKPRYWNIKPVHEVNQNETGWTHLLRTVHSLGTNADGSDFGEYSVPKRYVIAPGAKPRYDDYDFPASSWLPPSATKRDHWDLSSYESESRCLHVDDATEGEQQTDVLI